MERDIYDEQECGPVWSRNYNLAVEFFTTNGHINIPSDYIGYDADRCPVKLGLWLARARREMKCTTNARFFYMNQLITAANILESSEQEQTKEQSKRSKSRRTRHSVQDSVKTIGDGEEEAGAVTSMRHLAHLLVDDDSSVAESEEAEEEEGNGSSSIGRKGYKPSRSTESTVLSRSSSRGASDVGSGNRNRNTSAHGGGICEFFDRSGVDCNSGHSSNSSSSTTAGIGKADRSSTIPNAMMYKDNNEKLQVSKTTAIRRLQGPANESPIGSSIQGNRIAAMQPASDISDTEHIPHSDWESARKNTVNQFLDHQNNICNNNHRDDRLTAGCGDGSDKRLLSSTIRNSSVLRECTVGRIESMECTAPLVNREQDLNRQDIPVRSTEDIAVHAVLDSNGRNVRATYIAVNSATGKQRPGSRFAFKTSDRQRSPLVTHAFNTEENSHYGQAPAAHGNGSSGRKAPSKVGTSVRFCANDFVSNKQQVSSLFNESEKSGEECVARGEYGRFRADDNISNGEFSPTFSSDRAEIVARSKYGKSTSSRPFGWESKPPSGIGDELRRSLNPRLPSGSCLSSVPSVLPVYPRQTAAQTSESIIGSTGSDLGVALPISAQHSRSSFSKESIQRAARKQLFRIGPSRLEVDCGDALPTDPELLPDTSAVRSCLSSNLGSSDFGQWAANKAEFDSQAKSASVDRSAHSALRCVSRKSGSASFTLSDDENEEERNTMSDSSSVHILQRAEEVDHHEFTDAATSDYNASQSFDSMNTRADQRNPHDPRYPLNPRDPRRAPRLLCEMSQRIIDSRGAEWIASRSTGSMTSPWQISSTSPVGGVSPHGHSQVPLLSANASGVQHCRRVSVKLQRELSRNQNGVDPADMIIGQGKKRSRADDVPPIAPPKEDFL